MEQEWTACSFSYPLVVLRVDYLVDIQLSQIKNGCGNEVEFKLKWNSLAYY